MLTRAVVSTFEGFVEFILWFFLIMGVVYGWVASSGSGGATRLFIVILSLAIAFVGEVVVFGSLLILADVRRSLFRIEADLRDRDGGVPSSSSSSFSRSPGAQSPGAQPRPQKGKHVPRARVWKEIDESQPQESETAASSVVPATLSKMPLQYRMTVLEKNLELRKRYEQDPHVCHNCGSLLGGTKGEDVSECPECKHRL